MANNRIKTKAYTLNRLITEVSGLSKSQGRTSSDVINALSPIAGSLSAKFTVIDSFLNGNLDDVLSGYVNTIAGTTARARLLNALKKRKQLGYFYG